MFDNPEVSLDSLPAMESVRWQPLAARYRGELVLGHALFLAAAMVVVFGSSALGMNRMPMSLLPAALGYAAIHTGLAAVWAVLALKHKGYALRRHDILYKSGVIWRRTTALPFNRIQHVETTSGVLDRLFGLASIVIYTAGGTGGDLKIHGLESGHAERLREHILDRAGQEGADSATAPGPGTGAKEPLRETSGEGSPRDSDHDDRP